MYSCTVKWLSWLQQPTVRSVYSTSVISNYYSTCSSDGGPGWQPETRSWNTTLTFLLHNVFLQHCAFVVAVSVGLMFVQQKYILYIDFLSSLISVSARRVPAARFVPLCCIVHDRRSAATIINTATRTGRCTRAKCPCTLSVSGKGMS